MSSSHLAVNTDINLPDKQARNVLLTLLFGGIVVSLSNSALNPAIPIFMSEFDVDIIMGGWVMNAYVLAMSVGLMLSGYLNKKFALKRTYVAAIIGFILGSIMGMQASSMQLVIAARAIQGLSGGLIIPLSIGMLYQVYPKHRHGRVMALWGIVIMLSLSIGPLVGAYLVEMYDWWMLFSITLPLSVVAMIMAWLLLPNSHLQKANKPFDMVGFVGLLMWLVAVTAWLSSLKSGSLGGVSSMVTWLTVAVFGLAAVLWWRYESRHNSPLINVHLFKNDVYLHSTVISVTQTLGLMICLVLLPVIIQGVMGESAIWTGIILLVATVAASVTTHYAGRRVDKFGAREIGIWGIGISAVSTFMLAWCLSQPSLWLLLSVMTLRGIGVGLSYLPTTTVGFSSLPKDSVTEGAALNNISRRIASAIFITLVTVYIEGREAQLLALSSDETATQATQEAFVFIAVMLFVSLFSASKLPKPDEQAN